METIRLGCSVGTGLALVLFLAVGTRTVRAQVPDHPIITEVYTDPPGANDGPAGREPSNLHQGYIELYLPTCASANPALVPNCDSLKLTFYEVEGDKNSSGVELVNYRFDLPPFDLDPTTPPAAGVIARPTTGVVVLGWVDYDPNNVGTCASNGAACNVFAEDCVVGNCKGNGALCSVAAQDCADLTVCKSNCVPALIDLAGTPSTRTPLINRGMMVPPPPPDDFTFIAINGHHFTGTSNFALLNTCSVGPCAGESLIQLPSEAKSGVIQNGSAAYLLVNRDITMPGYVELYDDQDSAHVPPLSNADPALAAGSVLGTASLMDGLAGNDDKKFKADRQPTQACGDPNPANCEDLQTVLPAGGAFSLLIPQIPEKDKTRDTPTVGNGYARVFVDVPKTTEDPLVTDDPAVDAFAAYRLIRNNGPFFPTPGVAPFTTSAPQLSVATSAEQLFNVLTRTTGRPGLLTANTGGLAGIDISVSGGTSSDPTVASFAAGLTAFNVTGQSFGFPSVAITPTATAADLSTASATVTVSATNSVTGAPVGSHMVTVTATVIDPSTGLDAAGMPVATVFCAVQTVPVTFGVNGFLQTDVGQFLAARQANIVNFETLGNSFVLLDPTQDLTNTVQTDAMIKGLPKVGVGEECRNWKNPAGPPGKLDLVDTILMSAEVQSLATTYDGSVAFNVPCGTCSIDLSLCSIARQDCPIGGGTCIAPETFSNRARAINLNFPDIFTFNGTFTPSERVSFADANGLVGEVRSGLSNATTTRTFELLIVDTNLRTSSPIPGDVETGQTDDFGLVVEVLDTEPGAPVVPGQFVFLSFTGGLEGADIDPLVGTAGNVLLNLIYFDLDNLHDVFGIRSLERAILVDSGNNTGEIEVVEAYSLNPVTVGGCLVDADCDDNVFCNGTETCVMGVCQPGTAVNCNDAFACTTDSCNEATNMCDHIPDNALCSNGLFCDGDEVCDVAVGCRPGATPCPGQGCNEALDVCVPGGCFVASSAETELGINTAGATIQVPKNRYLTIRAVDGGRQQAVRVTIVSLPGVFAPFNGRILWAGLPKPLSGGPGNGFVCGTDPGCVVNPPAVPCCVGNSPFFMTSQLQCTPFFTDWSQAGIGSIDGFVHLYHELIIPGGTYVIQLIDDTCDPNQEVSFSTPLTLNTSGRWADMCAPGVAGTCQASPDAAFPDTDINDLIGALNAFGGKILTKIRADLQGVDPSSGVAIPALDGTIDITEISATQQEFSSAQGYPFAPPATLCGVSRSSP